MNNQRPLAYHEDAATRTLQAARSLFKAQQFDEAEQMLLTLYSSPQHQNNYRVLKALGEVCFAANKYEECQNYYQLALSLDEKKLTNTRIFVHLAQIYRTHESPAEAVQILHRSETLNPNDAQTLFELAVTYESLDEYDNARLYYRKSINKNNQKAIVYFKFAMLLLEKFGEMDNARHLLENAVRIRPENEEYKAALDAIMVELNEQKESEMKVHYIDDASKEEVARIGVIIYHLDVITFGAVRHDLDISDIERMKPELLFGTNDRIEKLIQHFRTLGQHPNHIRLNVVSSYHCQITAAILCRASLLQYFEELLLEHPIQDIKEIPLRYRNMEKESILYVDINASRNKMACEYGKIIQLKPHEMLPGLTLLHLQHIERCIQSPLQCNLQIDSSLYENTECLGLMKQDSNVYAAMKTETDLHYRSETEPQVKPSCHVDLNVYAFITTERKDWKYTPYFIEFLNRWWDITIAITPPRRGNPRSFWIAANMLSLLLNFEQNDYEIYSKLAQCLSYLRLDDAADEHYRIALDLKSDSISTRKSYGIHLSRCKQFDEAKQQFDIMLEQENNDPNSSGAWKRDVFFFSTYARCCDHSGYPEEADNYYRKALSSDNKRDKTRTARYHSNYALFLRHSNRKDESYEAYMNAFELSPQDPYLCCSIADLLCDMDRMPECKEYLEKALYIDPEHERAHRSYSRYFHREYDPHDVHRQDVRRVDGDVADNDIDNDWHSIRRDIDEAVEETEGKRDEAEEEKKMMVHMDNETTMLKMEQMRIKSKIAAERKGIGSRGSSSNQSVSDGTMLSTDSKYHAQNAWQLEFNRVYWRRFGALQSPQKGRFRDMYIRLQMHGLNDIRIVIRNEAEALRKQFMEAMPGSDCEQIVEQIIHLFAEYKQKHARFVDAIEIDDAVETLMINGIFTLDAFRALKNKDELQGTLGVETMDRLMAILVDEE